MRQHQVFAVLTYPPDNGATEGVEGRLIYVRSAVTADAPWDVRAYRKRFPAFPNDSTINQLYTDEKFEAYRALGYHNTRAALGTSLSDDVGLGRPHDIGIPPRRNAQPPVPAGGHAYGGSGAFECTFD